VPISDVELLSMARIRQAESSSILRGAVGNSVSENRELKAGDIFAMRVSDLTILGNYMLGRTFGKYP
jgi:hypothetical protein